MPTRETFSFSIPRVDGEARRKAAMLDRMGPEPILDPVMRQGEGTG